jgi:hypothetical protein
MLSKDTQAQSALPLHAGQLCCMYLLCMAAAGFGVKHTARTIAGLPSTDEYKHAHYYKGDTVVI